MPFFETVLIATIPAVITAAVTYLGCRHEILKYKADSMSERAARHYLSNKTYKARTFGTLKKHLGGWDNDEDGLRRILVRAGAIRVYDVTEGVRTEMWKLLSRKVEEDLDREWARLHHPGAVEPMDISNGGV